MIYADNAATTRVSDEVMDAMRPYFCEKYGNASSIYRLGRVARGALDASRKTIASLIGASPAEVFFTSCGSEANNWALKGTAHRLMASGKKHIVTSSIEHHSVLNSAKALEKEGFDVTYLPVDALGQVSACDVKKAIRPDTALVSIMYANNEIGTVQPVSEIGEVCHEAGVLFHTDAVQAVGTLPVHVKEQGIDLLSMSAHKFYGPKGIGILYCKRGNLPLNLIDGGSQEYGHRAGTENVALAVGMAKALESAVAERKKTVTATSALRNRIQSQLLTIPGTTMNGHPDKRLPGILNISFSGVDGQSLLFRLDLEGLSASSGSACTSGSLEPSHVLLALGIPYELAHGSLRISLGKYNTEEDADEIVKIVTRVVTQLRNGK